MLEVRDAVCGYGDQAVARNISFSAGPGEVISILGANGAGKTTLFKSILGHLKLMRGEVLLEGRPIEQISRKKIARFLGYVPQSHTPPFPYKVLDVVVMGRTAGISLFAAPSRADIEIAREALNNVGLSSFEDKIYTEISGGERQLVLIARALTQQPKVLVMDEPTANLDFGNQIRMLIRISELAEKGLSVILTTHFPDHAFLCASKIAVIKSREEFLTGKAEDIITSGLLREIYGIGVSVEKIMLKEREATVCVPTLAERINI